MTNKRYRRFVRAIGTLGVICKYECVGEMTTVALWCVLVLLAGIDMVQGWGRLRAGCVLRVKLGMRASLISGTVSWCIEGDWR